MSKTRKSCMVTAESHAKMLEHFKEAQSKAQEGAEYPINPPNSELWVSDAILEKIERETQ